VIFCVTSACSNVIMHITPWRHNPQDLDFYSEVCPSSPGFILTRKKNRFNVTCFLNNTNKGAMTTQWDGRMRACLGGKFIIKEQ
jgi:hypothetical protein